MAVDCSISFWPTKNSEVATPMMPMARPIAPPVMPLIDSCTRWSMLSGGATGAPLASRPPCCKWKWVWLRIEQGFVEAAVQPAAPLAMQGRRDQVPDADDAGILEEDEQDEKSGAVEQIGQRRRVAGVVEEGDRVDQFARGLGHPDAGLACGRREQRDHGRQRPGFHPAFREPVGSHQAPEAAHRGNRRQRRRLCFAVSTCAPET